MHKYEAPEFVELGEASELTLGLGPSPDADACDCNKCSGSAGGFFL